MIKRRLSARTTYQTTLSVLQSCTFLPHGRTTEPIVGALPVVRPLEGPAHVSDNDVQNN